MSDDRITAARMVAPAPSKGERLVFVPEEAVDARAVYLFGPVENPEVLAAWLDEGDRWAYLFGAEDDPIIHPRARQELLAEEGLQVAAAYTCLLRYRCFPTHGEWTEQMRDLRMTHDSLAVKMLDMNTHFYPHFYQNLKHLPGAYHGASLYGNFSGVPAIICGAGPSLDGVLSQLISIRDRALVIGCGSALTAMNRSGVVPHLGVAFSSSDEEADRFRQAHRWQFPVAYRLRLNRHAHAQLVGPRIYTNGSCGLRIARWVEGELGIRGEELQEGPSVVHLATDLALQMGCDPIIYVGLDLAYTGGTSYASGVGAEDDGERLWANGFDGKPVQTKAPWLTEAQLLGALVCASRARVWNATGGGLGVPGVSNAPLDACSSHWPKRPIAKRLAKALVPMPQVTPSTVTATMQTLQASLRRSLCALDVLAYRDDVVCEVELSMELAYQEVLEPMLHARQVYLARVYDQFSDQTVKHREQWQWLRDQTRFNLTLLERNI